MASPATGQLVDDMESSFQACLAAITNPDNYSAHDSEEVKTGVEQTIQRFLDLAKQVECFFLQKRLLLSVQKPEQIILEDINELKNELARKEQLLQKYYEKLQYWQNLITDSSAASRPPQPPMPNMGQQPSQPIAPQVGPPPPPPTPQMATPPIPPPHQMTPPQQQAPPPPPPPPQYQQPHFATQAPSVPSSTTGQGMPGLPPGQQSIMPQTHQIHPGVQHLMTHQSPAGMQGGLQGPLAYLERTTSNIGMPDPRR